MSSWRRFSFLWVSLILLVAAVVATVLLQGELVGQIGTLVLLALLLILWFMGRRGDVTPADPEKRLRRLRGGARPLVVHFYSDFSLRCLLMRLRESRLEQTYQGRCEFMHIDVGHPAVAGLVERLPAHVGDWLLFDRSGKLAGQYQGLTEERIQRFLAGA